MAYRLGWAMYWTCLALSGAWVLFWLNAGIKKYVEASPLDFSAALDFSAYSDGGISETWQSIAYGQIYSGLRLVLPVLALYALGRALRYVLSGQK